MTPERDTELFRLEVPARCLDAGLRHAMAAGPFHQIPDFSGRFDFLPDDHRCEDLLDRDPSGIGPLIRVPGTLAAGHLAPAFCSIRILDANENYSSLVSAAKA